jgi:hypothetical protein
MGFLRSRGGLLLRIMNLLKQLISDGEMPSTMRVMGLLIVAPVMIVWAILCIKRGEFIPMPMELVSIIIAALGAKAWQARSENSGSPAQPQPSTPNP